MLKILFVVLLFALPAAAQLPCDFMGWKQRQPDQLIKPAASMELVNPWAKYDHINDRDYDPEIVARFGPLSVRSNYVARQPGQQVYYAQRERAQLCVRKVCPTLTANRYRFKIGFKILLH